MGAGKPRTRTTNETEKVAMSDCINDLTGSLPPLMGGAHTADSTDQVRKLLAEATANPKVIERTERIDAYIQQKVTRLADLRKAAALTQAQVAGELGVSQPEVSKLEGRDTHMVDTLSRFVAATGGTLRMIVEYEDGTSIEYAP